MKSGPSGPIEAVVIGSRTIFFHLFPRGPRFFLISSTIGREKKPELSWVLSD